MSTEIWPSQVAKAQNIGGTAQVLLERNRVALVQGVTSRGMFLSLEGGWVVYLTHEPDRGPLTVNLDVAVGGLRTGAEVLVQGDSLRFQGGCLVTGLKTAGVWQVPRRAAVCQPAPGWYNRLMDTSRLVLDGVGDRGVAGLLGPLLGLDRQVDIQPWLVSNCLRLQAVLHAGDWQAALPLAEAFLGYGIGLTPSGDDLVQGLLLGLNRLPTGAGLEGRACTKGAFTLTPFGGKIVQAARSRTTSLSASLIACAARGQADELLVAALDGMTSGSLSPYECAHLLLAWGSSSGADCLAGMALAFPPGLGRVCKLIKLRYNASP